MYIWQAGRETWLNISVEFRLSEISVLEWDRVEIDPTKVS